MFLGMGPTELIIILVIALLIFGPKNLPKLGSAVGKTVKNVREGMEGEVNTSDDESEEVVEEELPEPEPEPEPVEEEIKPAKTATKKTSTKKASSTKSAGAKKSTTKKSTSKKSTAKKTAE